MAFSNSLAHAHLPQQHLLPGWGGWHGGTDRFLVRSGPQSWSALGNQAGDSGGWVSDDETVKDADWEIGTIFGKCVEVNVQNCVGGGESD